MHIIPSSRLLSRAVAISMLALTAAFGSGCFLIAVGAAGAAGAGTVAYVKGELDATFGNPYEPVSKAAEVAVQQLQFMVVGEAKDALATNITVRTATDKKVTIVVTRQADNLTKVQIRVGVFGDEQLSRAILDQIRRNI